MGRVRSQGGITWAGDGHYDGLVHFVQGVIHNDSRDIGGGLTGNDSGDAGGQGVVGAAAGRRSSRHGVDDGNIEGGDCR